MSAQIINGNEIARKILEDVKARVEKMAVKPLLCVIRVEGDLASEIYIRKKREACAETCIGFNDVVLNDNITQEELIKTVEKYNHDDNVTGILIQLPLPKGLDTKKITAAINPAKDVDGLNPSSSYVSATTLGIMKLLESIDFKFEGANAVMMGASDLVGKPTALELIKRNCTVSVCHDKTKNISFYTKQADLIVVAVGQPNLLTKDMIKEGAVIIDVGINKVDGKLVGDVDFENVKEKASYVTPVPGGVGPMTVACLMLNLSS